MRTRKFSAGLTLIELAAAMTIASVATIGLGSGISSIVGFYQDDWVTRDVRFWGYEAIEYISDKFEKAKRVEVRPPWNGYDGLLITPKSAQYGPILNIQGSKQDGLIVNGQPILDYAPFPSQGVYRSSGQRLIELESFKINPIIETREELRSKPFLTKLKDSLWQLEMVISVTTEFEGEETVEYVKFRRVLWARDKYFI